LGYKWQEKENLVIDWTKGVISWQNPQSKDQALEKQRVPEMQQLETETMAHVKDLWEGKYPEVFTAEAFNKLPG
jgi:hypothetical protein